MAQRKPTGRQRASDRVYEMIRDEISNGRYKVGEHLTEGALAERLAVSRTPVREAIQRLCSEGFVELSPHSGAVIKGWSRNDVREVFETRAHLESMAAGLAARNPSADDIAQLTALCDVMERLARKEANDLPGISENNRAFHAQVLRMAGNGRMAEIALQLMDLGFLVRAYKRFGQENILRSLSDHRSLVEAIRLGDSRWAEAIMYAHILTAASIFTGTEEVDEPATVRLAAVPTAPNDPSGIA
jgi:DNA-binding GntR family transcriptional regulator